MTIGFVLFKVGGRPANERQLFVEQFVSVLTIIVGVILILEVPGLLYSELQPYALAMDAIGALTVVVDLIEIGAAWLVKRITVTPKPGNRPYHMRFLNSSIFVAQTSVVFIGGE